MVWVRLIQKLAQLSVPEWEINKGIQFIPHVSAVGEAFQVDNQHRWQRPQVQFLGGLLVLLAVWTIPKRPTHTYKQASLSVCFRHCLAFFPHHGSSAPSFSLVVNSSMQSFSLKNAFFCGLYSMLSCLSKSCVESMYNELLETSLSSAKVPYFKLK